MPSKPDGIVDFLVGQVMKATQGKANPEMARRLLEDRLWDTLRDEENHDAIRQ